MLETLFGTSNTLKASYLQENIPDKHSVPQQVIAGFHELISVMTNLTDDVPGSDEVTGKDADKVSDAFKEVGAPLS